METAQFLRAVWPSRGLYIIARLLGKHFRHQACDSVEEAAAYATSFDQQGVPVYFAVASFRSRDVVTQRPDGSEWHQIRTHKNVLALRSFFMDLDVKPGNERAFSSQLEAIDGLGDFCVATGLPAPTVVSSGGGVHTYWTLSNDILPEQWKPVAETLKALCAHHKFKADPAVTADPARVLRPVGTWNRKSNPPRPVELVDLAAPVEFGVFSALVSRAAKAAGIKANDGIRPVERATESINQAFEVQRDFPPCSAYIVADKCAQLRAMRDTRGLIPEPHWYACIQLLCHSVEGDELIHEWSKGDSRYSASEVDRKISQIRVQALGPTLCTTFESRNPSGCDGCPFRSKISSPVQLGARVVLAPAPVVEVPGIDKTERVTLPQPPLPFERAEGGGIYVEEDGVKHKIYPYDFYPTEIAFDEHLGYETVRFRHFLPQEGWKEFIARSSLIAKPVEFEVALRDQHVQPLIRNKMAMYGDAYLRTLREENKMRRLFKSQGWKNDDTEFVLGNKLYRPKDTIHAGFSQRATEFLTPFQERGSLAVWRDLTWALGTTPEFAPHMFMLLLGFAAPLLKLAGREGFTAAALGVSGAGKSTMARFMSSIYGHPKDGWVGRKDTELARMQRLGAYYSLPVYMDEVTTIDAKELRDLIYAIPTGKNRAAMTQDYKLRPIADWVTIFVTSTNDSLQQKLQLEKANAEAEALRLFEFRFPRIPAFGPIAKEIPKILDANHGVAGPVYVRYLVDHRDQIRDRLRTIVEEAETAYGMGDRERFWSQAVALSVYGGQLARSAGVIDFAPEMIHGWLHGETQRMRNTLEESVLSPITTLATYLNETVGERLTVTKTNIGYGLDTKGFLREISQRYEQDAETLWIDRRRIQDWLTRNHFNYADVRDDLITRGVLIAERARRNLGAGTTYSGGQTQCWQVKMNHPELRAAVEEKACPTA